MLEFLQVLITGLGQGCLYGLIALGFVLIYKATEIVNFAQGDLMMMGAFFGFTYIVMLGLPFWLGLILAMATMAVGIVMIKPLLNRSPLLWVTEIRLAAGILFLVLYLAWHPRRRAIIGSVGSVRHWGYTFWGSFAGAYLSMILWISGMKFTQASIAAALNQSNNIFIFVLAAIFLKEPINRQRVAGIVLGVAGSFLVIFA